MSNLTEPITGGAGSTPTVVQGQGTAGTPAGGVVTMQGDALGPDGLSDWVKLVSGWNGSFVAASRVPVIFKTLSAVAIATEATIWTPTAGKKFRLMGGNIASSVVGNVTLRDNTAGTIIAVVPCGVAGVAYPIFGPNAGNGILSAVVNNLLTATGPALATLSGNVFGTEE